MNTEHPTPADIPALRRLWTAAFGDTNEFLDHFFNTGFSPERCLCLRENGVLAAALYWFDCFCGTERIAYLYAVATDPVFRGQGCCRSLMAHTHALLRQRGYSAAMLVPGSDSLRKMYANMGYTTCSQIREFSCKAAEPAVALREISSEEYACLRRSLLPAGGVVQEGENLSFLATDARFFAGEDLLLVVSPADQEVRIVELLGSENAAPGILRALGKKRGNFRVPGNEMDFAMFLPLANGVKAPTYFGLAFD